MKSGPALRQLTAHRAIHDAAQGQAITLTEQLKEHFHHNEEEACYDLAKQLITHWEERIIAHADAEDHGLYKELLEEGNVPAKDLYMLMRDHDLFRKIVAHIKKLFAEKDTVDVELISIFQSLLLINHFHHLGEEETLFPS